MSLGANLLSIFVPSYFLTVTYLANLMKSFILTKKKLKDFKVQDIFVTSKTL